MWLISRQLDPIETTEVVSHEDPGFLAAPSLEPAYDFRVTVYCSRQPTRRRRSCRWPVLKDEIAQVCEIVRGTIRLSTRKFSIFDPAAAEQAVNHDLAEALAEAGCSRGPVSPGWIASAELAPPEEALKLMRETMEKEYRIRTKANADNLLITKVSELREGWEQFLNEAATSRNAQHAVRLAENPDDIAKVLEDVLKDRRKGAEELLILIDKIVDAQRSVDILDLVVMSESVLRKTLEMIGIPLPEAVEGALLEPLDSEA
jgi:hypothetical protein